ncbi:Aste57867_18665 [Aphanomyces stellatus]|uniref:Aste57867_18665 protein n=1 Tax=Aphanomyces stellatus TaxID=120398 RepID=A0A485LAQ9_9STRA|nr:hypothetical protein As57867_018603 [Aphanomyces stellatus]VFT95400.1 Aste57867_18665 [Aphanomyces stellatus]
MNINSTNNTTAFLEAAKAGHSDQVRAILEEGTVDVNAMGSLLVDEYGVQKSGSALMWASRYNRIETVLVLLATGNIQAGVSALSIASQNGHSEVVYVLLACPEINVNHVDANSNSALHFAAQSGRVNAIKELLSCPAINANLVNKNGSTALHIAAEIGDIEAMNVLLACSRIDTNIMDQALHLAKQQSHIDVVVLLSYKTVDIEHIHNKDGTLLIQSLAKILCHDLAMKLLLLDLPVKILDGDLVRRQDHSFSWTTFLDAKFPVPQAVRDSCIEAILNHKTFESHSRNLFRELAFTKDQYGREVLEVTDSTTRKYFYDRLYFCGRYELFEGPPVHVSPTAVVVFAYDHGIFNHVFNQHADGKMGVLTQDGFVSCNQILGRWSAEHNASTKKNMTNSKLWQREFATWNKASTEHMSKDEFLRFCAQQFGRKFKVALKFMRHEDEYKREHESRLRLDSNVVLKLLPTVEMAIFQRHISSLQPINGDIDMAKYHYMLAMPAADRSLEDIYLKERPSDTKTRAFLHEIAFGLACLHNNGLVHGDLKKLNILRADNKLKLIDFDASTKIGDALGVKFSSGILPPEMFYELKGPDEICQYEEYWGDQVNDSKRWNKLKPRNNFIIRTYRRGHTGDLPYSLVEATPAVDMWSFGCLMYQMLCGMELIPTDINQDIVTDKMKAAAQLTDEVLHRRIENNIADESAQHLIKQLLVVDPKNRSSVQEVLNHTYFTGAVDFSDMFSKLAEIEQSNKTLQHQVETLETEIKATAVYQVQSTDEITVEATSTLEAAMQGIHESNEVVVPTSFALLPFKLDQTTSASLRNQQLHQFLSLGKDVLGGLPKDKNKVMDWIAGAGPVLQPLLDELKRGQSMYLYLIDEGTGEIIVPEEHASVYPIEIPTTDDAFWAYGMPWVEKGLVLLKAGVACIKATTKVGSYMEAHHLGPWAKENKDQNEDTTKEIDTKDDKQKMSSEKEKKVEQKKTVNTKQIKQVETKKLKDDIPEWILSHKDVPAVAVRGAELRQLKKWFLEHDPEQSYGGLKRVMTDQGNILWTILDTVPERARLAEIEELVQQIAPSST